MSDYKTLIFVVAVLHSLPEKWRGIGRSQAFEEILRARKGVNLHTAWFLLQEEGLTGEFFPDFVLHPLYERSNLDQVLAQGVRHLLVRPGWHLDLLDEESQERMMRNEGIPNDAVMLASARLNEILEEQEAESRSPANA